MPDEPIWRPYDEMAGRFLAHAADGSYNAHYDRPAVLGELGDVRGLTVLDAGCGPGLYLAELLSRGARVTGFDASTAMLDLARERVGPGPQLDRAVLGEPLPYPGGAFDRVVCALAIHYAADPAAAFAEFHRVLRPGGTAVVSTQHPVVDWLRKGGSYFDRVLETDVWRLTDGPQQVRFWRTSLTGLCDAALDAGFRLARLLEPRPARSMRERYPEDFAQLEREPAFLVLRLVKPGPAAAAPVA